jgi:hypothetical protein
MKHKIDANLKAELKLSLRINLSKLDILEIFILIDMFYELISRSF